MFAHEVGKRMKTVAKAGLSSRMRGAHSVVIDAMTVLARRLLKGVHPTLELVLRDAFLRHR